VPDPAARQDDATVLGGDVPSPVAAPAGCGFHPRCPRADGRCRAEDPFLTDAGPGRWAACHHPLEVAAPAASTGS
jgi:oligopeptide/dipeptide ABC transporter ATP-binding protein